MVDLRTIEQSDGGSGLDYRTMTVEDGEGVYIRFVTCTSIQVQALDGDAGWVDDRIYKRFHTNVINLNFERIYIDRTICWKVHIGHERCIIVGIELHKRTGNHLKYRYLSLEALMGTIKGFYPKMLGDGACNTGVVELGQQHISSVLDFQVSS